jgi:hypothetical protein
MTILITTIPDDPKEWAGWLEQHLVGLRLRDLIDELRLLPDSTLVSLKSLLNETHLLEVRKRGLASLTVNQIRALMASPESLLELQEDVLVNGGEYWRSLPPDHDMQHSLERVRSKLKKPASQEDRATLATEHLTAARSRSKLLIGLVSAAAILLIGVVAWRMQPGGSGTILGQPGLLVNNVASAAEYLNRIADAGNEWFDVQPKDAAELIVLLQNVSNDCQVLIDAEHPALTPQEREWFVAKCQNWKSEFDTTLASLQSGLLNFEAAKASSDRTMMKLINAVRQGAPAA